MQCIPPNDEPEFAMRRYWIRQTEYLSTAIKLISPLFHACLEVTVSAAYHHSVVIYNDPATTAAYEEDLFNAERDVRTCEVGGEVHVPEPECPYEGHERRSFSGAFCHYSYQSDEPLIAVLG